MREGIGVWEGGEEEDEERHREMGGGGLQASVGFNVVNERNHNTLLLPSLLFCVCVGVCVCVCVPNRKTVGVLWFVLVS